MAIRLVGGNTESEGHVQILRNGLWGAVCDVEWDLKDAGESDRNEFDTHFSYHLDVYCLQTLNKSPPLLKL